jgi:hypothetical protein
LKPAGRFRHYTSGWGWPSAKRHDEYDEFEHDASSHAKRETGRNMRHTMKSILQAAAALALTLAVAGSAQALTLAELDAGASFSTPDGRLTFQNFSVTTGDVLAGLDLSLIEVEALPSVGFGFKVLEFDAPLVVAGDAIGSLRIAYDVVANSALITSVGLRFTGTAIGAGASARIFETVTSPSGVVTLEAVRIAGGTQDPEDVAELPAGARQIGVVKEITLDTSSRLGMLAQISEFEQSYAVAPIPEPGAFAIFAASLGLVVAASRRRWL